MLLASTCYQYATGSTVNIACRAKLNHHHVSRPITAFNTPNQHIIPFEHMWAENSMGMNRAMITRHGKRADTKVVPVGCDQTDITR